MLFLSMSSCSQFQVPAKKRGSAWHSLPSCRKAAATVAAATATDNGEESSSLDHDAMYSPCPQQISGEEHQSCDGDSMGRADDGTSTRGDDKSDELSTPLLGRVWDPLTHACASDDPTHWTPFSLPSHTFSSIHPGGGPVQPCTAAPLSLASEPRTMEGCRGETSSRDGTSSEALQFAVSSLRASKGTVSDSDGSLSLARKIGLPPQRWATKEMLRLKVRVVLSRPDLCVQNRLLGST